MAGSPTMDHTHRSAWECLPSALQDAVCDHLGPLVKVEPIHQGRRSALAAVAPTRGDEQVFIKGAPISDAKAVEQLDREAAIAPHVALISPALLYDLTEAGWRMLIFEHVPGRRADYSPDSPDLPAVLDAVAALDA